MRVCVRMRWRAYADPAASKKQFVIYAKWFSGE